jgi:hypothetical protein
LDGRGVLEAMKLKLRDIEKSGRENVLHYCMGCHTISTMIYPVKSHYLLDKILWALGDDLVSSLYVPKSVREKMISKYQSEARFPLQIV